MPDMLKIAVLGVAAALAELAGQGRALRWNGRNRN